MRQNLSQQSRTEMPCISRPDALNRKAFGELPDDGFNSAAQIRQSAWKPSLFSFCRTKWRDYLQTFSATNFKPSWRPIVSVAERETADSLKQIFGNFEFVNVGRRKLESCNHAWQTNPKVKPHTEECLPCYFIIAISRYFTQTATPVSSRKATHLKRKAINQRNLRIKIKPGQNQLPQLFFDAPKVCRLACESRSMNFSERRKKSFDSGGENTRKLVYLEQVRETPRPSPSSKLLHPKAAAHVHALEAECH